MSAYFWKCRNGARKICAEKYVKYVHVKEFAVWNDISHMITYRLYGIRLTSHRMSISVSPVDMSGFLLIGRKPSRL